MERHEDRQRRAAEEETGKNAARNERHRQERIAAKSKLHQAIVEVHTVLKHNGTQNESDVLTASMVDRIENVKAVNRENGPIKAPLSPPSSPPQISQPHVAHVYKLHPLLSHNGLDNILNIVFTHGYIILCMVSIYEVFLR